MILQTLEKEGHRAQQEISEGFSQKTSSPKTTDHGFLFDDALSANYEWLAKEIKKLDLNQTSPIEALNFLVRMRQRLG